MGKVPKSRLCVKAQAGLKGMPYKDYLKTDAWAYTRKRAIARAQGRCQVCNGDSRLNVHHRTYKNLGRERRADVIVLCRECHALFHRERRIATEGAY